MAVKIKMKREMVVCYPPDDVPMMEDPDNPGSLIPDDTWLITEDEVPANCLLTEKESRLLTEPLYSNWSGTDCKTRFMVMADVGLFFSPTEPPLSPDTMLIINPKKPSATKGQVIRSYFVWRYGKVPDVVIEIVSNRKGGEATRKFKKYASIGVTWYVIFDPEKFLSKEALRVFRLDDGAYQSHPTPFFPEIGLGLTLWKGDFEDWKNETFLRWCDLAGNVIPTGLESARQIEGRVQNERRANLERQRADKERRRADKFAAKLRALGVDPSANGR